MQLKASNYWNDILLSSPRKENKGAVPYPFVASSQSLSTDDVVPSVISVLMNCPQLGFLMTYRDFTEKSHASYKLCVSTRGQCYKPSEYTPLLYEGENSLLPRQPGNSQQFGISEITALD